MRWAWMKPELVWRSLVAAGWQECHVDDQEQPVIDGREQGLADPDIWTCLLFLTISEALGILCHLNGSESLFQH